MTTQDVKTRATNVLKIMWERYGKTVSAHVTVKQMAALLGKATGRAPSDPTVRRAMNTLVEEGLAVKKMWAGGRRHSYRYDGPEVKAKTEAFNYAMREVSKSSRTGELP